VLSLALKVSGLVMCCTLMILTLVSSYQVDLQTMLNRSESDAARKGLLGHCENFHVVVFKTTGAEHETPLEYWHSHFVIGKDASTFHRDCKADHMMHP